LVNGYIKGFGISGIHFEAMYTDFLWG